MRERGKRAHFFVIFSFLAREGSPWADECNSHIPSMSSSSLQKVQLFFILYEPTCFPDPWKSITAFHEKHDLANKKALHTSTFLFGSIGRIHLFYVKLLNFSIYFFFPVPFKTIWRKRRYKCQKWDNFFRLSVAQVMHSISSSISVIYFFRNFLQVFKHQKVKKKAKPNSKKRGNQRE